MNFEEFKKLIQSHPEQLADRNAYTGLQKLSMNLAEQSPSSDASQNIKALLTELASGNHLNQLSNDQVAGLINFVNDSAIVIHPNDDFLKKLRTFLTNNLRGEGDILKRAYLLKLITVINPQEFTPDRFEGSEQSVTKKYPWLYADIIAQSENFDYLTEFILQLYEESESKERVFAEMMKHLEIWWNTQVLSRNSDSEDFVKQLSDVITKIRVDREFTDFFFQWANSNGFLRQEFRIVKLVNTVRPRLSESVQAAKYESLLAAAN